MSDRLHVCRGVVHVYIRYRNKQWRERGKVGGRARERNITQIFLDFAEDLLFLHPWAQDCRELNSPGRIPMVPGKTRCRMVCQNIFVHGSQTKFKKKKTAREKRPLQVEEVRLAQAKES